MCSPAGRDCIDVESQKSFDCKMSCVGLYADVGVSKKHTRLEDVPGQLKDLVEAYDRHKKRIVKNFVFNASAHSTNFGE